MLVFKLEGPGRGEIVEIAERSGRARRFYGIDEVGDSSLQALVKVDEPEAESVRRDIGGFSVDPLKTEIIDYQREREPRTLKGPDCEQRRDPDATRRQR